MTIAIIGTARDFNCSAGGWTSKMLAFSGYSVTGLDISPSMIELAKINCNEINNVKFFTYDYEDDINLGIFDCAIVYDALHHSLDEYRVIKNVFDSLKSNFVTNQVSHLRKCPE